MRALDDRRGQSTGFLNFFVGLGAGAGIIYYTQDLFGEAVRPYAQSTGQWSMVTEWIFLGGTLLAIAFVISSGIGLLLKAIYQRGYV